MKSDIQTRYVFVPSGKLSARQAGRRTEPQASRVGRKRPELPFFPEPGKNALIITGGWLVSRTLQLSPLQKCPQADSREFSPTARPPN